MAKINVKDAHCIISNHRRIGIAQASGGGRLFHK